MNRAFRFVLAAILLNVPARAAETIDTGPFSVDVTPRLSIRFDGKPLFIGDRCVSFRGLKPGAPVLVDPTEGHVTRRDNIITVVARHSRNSLRREIMVTSEALHITYELKVFGDTGGSHLQYDLLSPAESLDGAPYDAWCGLARAPIEKTTSVFSTQQTKPFEYLVRTVRYLVLKRPDGPCSIDFNPGGLSEGESNYGDKFSTTPYHDGKLFHFTMLCSGGRFGGIMRGKVVIRPGSQSYESLHSTAPVAYTLGYPVSLALNFSNGDSNGDYQPCAADARADRPFCWRNAKQVCIVERPTGGLLYHDFATAADGQTDGVLELHQRSGLYLLTLNVRDDTEDTGPFTVSRPEGPLLENIFVKRGEYWFKTAPFRIRNGKADLRFTGNWKIGALTLQPILYETEDFLFDQPFWNMETHPTTGAFE